jgi:hypothetical protein
MQKEIIEVNKLFKTKSALKALPETITVWHDMKLQEAEIDIVINSYNKPELTNETALNYILLEDKIPVNIIIVESSRNKNIFNQLIKHEKVSKILVEDHKASHSVYGAGSYGMAVSSAVGYFFSKSSYVFFSHSDMLALKKDFLGYLLSKLNEQVRIASFTQRHIIPFTGCMLINREVINESESDWLLYDENPYIEKNDFLKALCKLKINRNLKIPCHWIDAGESYIYEEIAKGNKVYSGTSFGGTKGLRHTPFDLLGITCKDINALDKNIPILYGKQNINIKNFKKKYKFVIKASKRWENLRWFLSRKKNYWRYSLDDEGDLIFIHHGRGTRRSLNRWLKFTSKVNSLLS